MATRIEISESNVVEIFVGDEPNPTIRQDQHPEGRDWLDLTEAQTWATIMAQGYEAE